MDTPSRIGSRRSGNSKQGDLSCDAGRMETLEKMDVHIQALLAKIDWDISRSDHNHPRRGYTLDVSASRVVSEDGLQRQMKNTSCSVHENFMLRDYAPP